MWCSDNIVYRTAQPRVENPNNAVEKSPASRACGVTQLWNTRDAVKEVKELKRDRLSIQAISQATGFDRKTIRKYLLKPSGTPVYRARSSAASKTGTLKAALNERLRAAFVTRRCFCGNCAKRNYAGGYTILTDWPRSQR